MKKATKKTGKTMKSSKSMKGKTKMSGCNCTCGNCC